MVSTYTTARNLEKPGRGDQVGVWDTPVNSNSDIIDAALGQSVNIALNNVNVVLSAAQFKCSFISFNSTLTGNVGITFPTSFTGPYTIANLCTGSSAFTVTLQTTAAGGQVVGCKPGEAFDIFNDGTTIRYRGLGHVGSYWDYGGSSVPNWVSACSVPPYLNCDGTTFSSVSYPALAVILGGTTLPDLRGRTRAYLNQGTGRMTSGGGGVDGNTVRAGGGVDNGAITTTYLPSVSIPVTVTDGRSWAYRTANGANGGASAIVALAAATSIQNNNPTVDVTGTITAQTAALGGGGGFPVMQPTCIGGITMIRAG